VEVGGWWGEFGNVFGKGGGGGGGGGGVNNLSKCSMLLCFKRGKKEKGLSIIKIH